MKSQIFNVHPIFELVKSLPVADFTAGDLTMTHQMRRGESGRKLCKNPMKSIQPRSSPPKTRCSPLETSLAFSTPPLHSIPLFPPFSPSLPSLQNHSSPASLSPAPKVQTRAELPCFLDNSFFFSFFCFQFSSNVRGSTRGGRRVHGRDREGAAGPPCPHRQQELRTHHAPPRVRSQPLPFIPMCPIFGLLSCTCFLTFSCKPSNGDRPCRWHDAGTYDAKTKTGGPNGSIRFPQEHSHSANAGIKIAIDLLGQYFFRQIHHLAPDSHLVLWKRLSSNGASFHTPVLLPPVQSQ